MTLAYMETIRRRYEQLGYTPYRWYAAADTPPWQPPATSPAAARVGLLSTAGAYALGQLAYHYKDDSSIRAIPASTPRENIRFSHITENYLVDARRDPDTIFPLGTLRELVADGLPVELAGEVLSCMGGIYSQRRVREETAPAVLEAFRRQDVDRALLVAM